MSDTILNLQNNLIGWVTVIGFIVTGVFALISIFNTQLKKTSKEADDNEDRVIQLQERRIKNLESTLKDQQVDFERRITAQTKLIEEQTTRMEELEKKLRTMSEENAKFAQYLERRDPEDIAYRKRGAVIFEMVEKAMPLVVETHTNMNKLVVLLETHFKPLVDVQPAQKLENAMKGVDTK